MCVRAAMKYEASVNVKAVIKGVLNMYRKYISLCWRAAAYATIFVQVFAFNVFAMSTEELARCLKKGGGIYSEGECHSMRIESLKRDQLMVSKKIRSELVQCTPQLVGYDYKSALTNYVAAQKSWELFINHNCDLIADTFGQGTAMAGDSLRCEIDLRMQNLKRSKDFLGVLNRKRSYLLQENHTEQFKQSPAIICK